MSIGTHLTDGMPNITGVFYAAGATVWQSLEGAFYQDGVDVNAAAQSVGSGASKNTFHFDSSRVFNRTANEVRIATVSVYVCITY
jgi:hypothetical protein